MVLEFSDGDVGRRNLELGGLRPDPERFFHVILGRTTSVSFETLIITAVRDKWTRKTDEAINSTSKKNARLMTIFSALFRSSAAIP